MPVEAEDGFVLRLIGNTGEVRRRALLLALLVAALAAIGAVGSSSGATPWHDPGSARRALARGELADVPAPTALTRSRDVLGRDLDGYGVPAALAVAFVLTLAGGWWLARERAARVLASVLVTRRRPRAPPRLPSVVHC
jgi:hypothetical protein